MSAMMTLKKFHPKRLDAAGDTIIEVLVVLAVLGLSLSISYATANKGLQQSRNAQEHSSALGIIDSQVELLRSAFAKKAQSSLPAAPFCLAPPTGAQLVNPTTLGAGFNENLANDNLTTVTYPVPCTQSSLYNISIVSRGGGIFDFRVRWFGTGDLGRQQEELTYKIGTIAATFTGGYIDPELPPPPPFSGAINVVAKAIPQTGPNDSTFDETPSCGNPAGNKSGTTVRMNGTGGPFTKSTDVSSTATFNTLQQGTSYSATISRSGWQVCSLSGSPAIASATAPVPQINATIRPLCYISRYESGYAFGNRRTDLDGYYNTFGVTEAQRTSSFVGSINWYGTLLPGYYWFVFAFSTGPSSGYYWIWEANWYSIPHYSCPS